MSYVYKNRKTYPGFREWTLAYALNFIGFVFLSLRNVLPDFITVISANALIALCFVLIARGLIDFAESEQNLWMDICPISVLILLFFYFVYFSPSVNARIVVISSTIMLISFRCAFITHRKITGLLDGKNRLLTAAFMWVASWLLLRTVLTVSLEGDIHNFMFAGAMQGFSIVVGEVGHITIAIGLIIVNAQRLEKDLVKADEEIKILRGFLPICSHCKKIRDDAGCWNQIESYISEHSDARFSHGICPDCAKKLYPDMDLYED